MKYSEHCKECQDKLGNPWYVVHRWLDEFAKDYWPLLVHRVERHHSGGVEEVRQQWGDEAAESAKLHIIADEGCIPEPDEIFRKYVKESKK